jgi:hypothetical protein
MIDYKKIVMDWWSQGKDTAQPETLISALNYATSTAQIAQGANESFSERVKKWYSCFGGPWDESDVEDFKLLNEVYNDGFEAAHELRTCGHSRGDYRDSHYVIGKPETYTGKESCIGCAAVAQAVAEEREAIMQYILSCRETGEMANVVQVFDVIVATIRARSGVASGEGGRNWKGVLP